MKLRTTMAATAAAVLAVAGLSATPAFADDPAPTCYGDYCSGQDPAATNCAIGARTIYWVDLSGARLELRWSDRCQTNWARWNQYPVGMKSDQLVTLAAVQETGYTQTFQLGDGVNGSPEGTYWSPMIYSPTLKVKAAATVWCGGMSLLDAAFDCATSGKVETPAG
ncbi:DUF2690 domain-containing protein [Kribbella sp. NPDC005582]|uniref:DUF2690 domain-containing protein n=1 Tax=Kribbella sp. NPDC005582 TaxID=3156893 RepID=UPI0033A88995